MNNEKNKYSATFGGGCFWCLEAIFQRINGVEKVVSGYCGGDVDNPSYEQVCSGNTGHAEVVQITYDPEKLSFEDLLEIFWNSHDPTTKNRQGNDIGTQYRSAIFYHNPDQKNLAESFKASLEADGKWTHPIVTEIEPLVRFWPAEDYHQDYFRNNPSNGYCAMVIRPKIEKFNKDFGQYLKTD